MAQRLIVEGKDAIALSEICRKRGLSAPKDYKSPSKYKAEFVKPADGVDKVKLVLREELQSPDVTNIGVILDANDVGVEGRFSALKNIIEETLNLTIPKETTISESGFHYKNETLTIGIWVMPNNVDNGYLENFICSMISEKEADLWNFVNEKVDELIDKKLQKFSAVKKQKALLHTYLAWQESPGLPMGTALTSNFIDANSHAADSFVKWFQKVFDLGE
jgi:hypothetical protein